jgi:hypothetical protein
MARHPIPESEFRHVSRAEERRGRLLHIQSSDVILSSNTPGKCAMSNTRHDDRPPNRYANVEQPRVIGATDIAHLFGKPDSWFSRDRVRKALYERGFPSPVIRGKWLRNAVEAWLEREGSSRREVRLAQVSRRKGYYER